MSTASRSLFRHADFMRLWTGQTISEFGSQISFIAVPLAAVIALHATPFQVGLLGTFQFLPFLAIGLPAGVWVDRWPRRPILITADCGRALLMASIPLAALLHALTMTQLYVVGLLAGCLTVFFDVAYQAYLPALIEREQLVDGNAKLSLSWSLASFVGPGTGGLLVGWLTAPVAVTADAISYVASVVSLLFIRRRETPPQRSSRASLMHELREGLRYVLGHRVLRLIAACTATANLFGNTAQAVLLLYAVRTAGLSPAEIGIWYAVGGLGAPLGALLAGRLSARWGIGRALLAEIVLGQLSGFLVPVAPLRFALPFFIAANLMYGIAIGYNIIQVSLRQAITPAEISGRMNATMRFLVWGTIPIGSFVGGILGTTIGLHATLWVAAFGGLLAVLPISAAPVRTLRTTPEPAPGDVTEARIEAAETP